MKSPQEEVQYLLNRRGCSALVKFVPGEEDNIDDELIFTTPDGENTYPFAIQLMDHGGRYQFSLVEYIYENGELVGGTFGQLYNDPLGEVMDGWPDFGNLCTEIAEKIKGHVFAEAVILKH